MKVIKSRIQLLSLSCIILLFILNKVISQAHYDFLTISNQIFDTFQSTSGSTLDTEVASLLSKIKTSYSWPDIDYTSTSQTNWAPGNHLTRMSMLAKAYSRPSSTYYGDIDLKEKIEGAMNYWLTLSPAPSSTNWFYLTIIAPKDIGHTLISMRKSPSGISSSLEQQMLAWMTKGVAIDISPAKEGSNLTDVAEHYIMRACLTENQTLLNQTINTVNNSIVIASREGIQIDNSYTAHGPQLYLYGYGRDYISGITNIATYLATTSYALSTEKIAIFTNFVRNGFLKVSRGAYVDFNVLGRLITRVNLGKADVSLIEKLKGIDLPENELQYNNAIQRMRVSKSASYNVLPEHIHYWRTDYTVHHRPGYMFGLRSISSRNSKTEMGNGENIKGYYLTEGATYIGVTGDEYNNIYPVWDWSKIPGTTVPQITTYPIRTSWGVNFGTVPFVGGVSDGIYGASTYAMSDYGTTAKKAWFYFDEEVVCLGAGINSTANQEINTTVNQCLLKTDVIVADITDRISTINRGNHKYNNNLKWALQGNVGYFFPSNGNVSLSNEVQKGNWASINTMRLDSSVSADVFKLWFNHGVYPNNASYAYIVAPGKSTLKEMQNYNSNNISILSNTSYVQAVRHNGLGIWQIVFYKAGEFTANQVTVRVNKPCVVMLKNVTGSEVLVHVSDPSQLESQIYLGIKTPGFTALRATTLDMPQGVNAGSTVFSKISNQNPVYKVPVEHLMKVTSIADAFVRSSGSGNTSTYADTNYGTNPTLTIKNESPGYDREVFIKFDISSFPTTPDSAVIQLRVNNSNTSITNTNWGFYLIEDNTWSETDINWNNKPIHSTKLGEVKGVSSGSWVKLNITKAIIKRMTTDKIVSIRIASHPTTTDGALIGKSDGAFNSRESPKAEYRPQLLYYGKWPEGMKTDSIAAIADTYVRSNKNAVGSLSIEEFLVARNQPDDEQEVYLKFDLRGIDKNIFSAKLRLNALENGIKTSWNISKAGNTYSTSADEWMEADLNWDNKPLSEDFITNIYAQDVAGFINFDITRVISNIPPDSILTLKVTATTDLYSSFSSSNVGSDILRPKIIYEYISPPTSNPLPVELIYFRGNTKEGIVNLSWATSSETNHEYFEIQRSDNARTFYSIAKVFGEHTSTSLNSYLFEDREAIATDKTLFYYRLKQVDFDGKSTYSTMISLSLPKEEQIFSIGPNPTSGKLRVFAHESYYGPLSLTILDKSGRILVEKKLVKAEETDFFLEQYPAGTYFLKIRKEYNQPQVLRFELIK